MKCLVVDDSATMRRIVVNALKSIGYDDVAEAGDGSDALQKCDASVELVITDWNMPVMGGLEFVKALRTPEVQEQLKARTMTPRPMGQEEFAAFWKTEREKFAAVVAKANIKVE